MHSALAMSVPRRKPLSTITGMRPFTACTISSSAFGARDEGFRNVPLVGGVELEPHRRAACRGDVLDRARGHGRKDHEMVARSCRLCGSDFAFGMKGLLAADRRDHDRARIAGAEDVGAHVELADV